MSFPKTFAAISIGLALMLGSAANAQDATEDQSVADLPAGATPAGGCFVEPGDLSDEEVQAFLGNPAELLTSHPDDGVALALEVAALAGSDTSTILPLVQLSAIASPTERNSIAAGLAQAAEACVASRPDIAEYIQLLVATSGNDELLVAFAASSDDLSVAALRGAGASSPVVGASPIGNTGSPSPGGAPGGGGGGGGGFTAGGGGGGGFSGGGGANRDTSRVLP